jgi:hypothetical protein
VGIFYCLFLPDFHHPTTHQERIKLVQEYYPKINACQDRGSIMVQLKELSDKNNALKQGGKLNDALDNFITKGLPKTFSQEP